MSVHNIPKYQTIYLQVTETQKQLINLKKNFKEEKRMKVDKVYLHFLGLSEDGEWVKFNVESLTYLSFAMLFIQL